MEKKCIALISGGMDSALAAKLMMDQAIEVYGFHVSFSWSCSARGKSEAIARELGIPLMIMSVGDEYLDVMRNPKYGYGRAINPCTDCHIYMCKRAKRYMEELGAGFVVTGEVVGQRPMSQRRYMLDAVERESELEGLLLRPMSAKLLKATLPEQLGIVDRSRLLGISGRSRRKQYTIAQSANLKSYSTPAGGCILTDEHFARKARDLFAHEEKPTIKDMQLLAIGRHYRIGPRTKVILGRDEAENLSLEGHAEEAHTYIRPDFAGPTALVAGEWTEGARGLAVTLILRHTKRKKLNTERIEFHAQDNSRWTVDCEALAAAEKFKVEPI